MRKAIVGYGVNLGPTRGHIAPRTWVIRKVWNMRKNIYIYIFSIGIWSSSRAPGSDNLGQLAKSWSWASRSTPRLHRRGRWWARLMLDLSSAQIPLPRSTDSESCRFLAITNEIPKKIKFLFTYTSKLKLKCLCTTFSLLFTLLEKKLFKF